MGYSAKSGAARCGVVSRAALGVFSVAVAMGPFPAAAQQEAAGPQAAKQPPGAGGGADTGTEETGIETIIVTAQRRQENLQTVPIAIDAFSGDTIAEAGIASLTQLSQLSTSFNLNTGGGEAQPFIRGIGSNLAGTGNYASVATYIDGVYVPRPNSLLTAAGDADSIESLQVLKGPQGSLYGRNALGGALVLSTRDPVIGEDFNGFVKETLGDFGVRRFSALLSGSPSDKLAMQLYFQDSHSDGFIDNPGRGDHDFDNEDGYQVRGKLLVKPAERLEVLLSGRYSEYKQDNLGYQQIAQAYDSGAVGPFAGSGLNNPQVFYAGTVLNFISGGVLAAGGSQADANNAVAQALPTVIGLAGQVRFPTQFATTFSNQIGGAANGVLPNRNGADDIIAGGVFEDLVLSARGKLSFDTFDVVSISAYGENYYPGNTDILRADPESLPDLTVLGFPASLNQGNIGFSADADTQFASEELYYLSTAGDVDLTFGASYFYETGTYQVTGDAFGTSTMITNSEYAINSISGYAQATYPLTERLDLTGGARYTREHYTLDDNGVPGQAILRIKPLDTSNVTYNAKLAYTVANWLVYGGYSTAFKSGSLNATNPAAGRVSEETIGGFEGGFKTDFAGVRVRLNGAAFHYSHDNIQLFVLDGGSNATFLVDGVDARIYGAELEIQALLTDRLTASLGTTLLHDRYLTDAHIVATGVVQPIKGNRLSLAPDAAVNGSLEYGIDLASGSHVSGRLSARYSSGEWTDQSNSFGSSGAGNGDYTVVNASISFRTPGDELEVVSYVNNLTEEEYFQGGTAAVGGLTQLATAGRPRHFGVSVRFAF
jgi:iron complex outermembrane receptor protein